MPRPVVHVRPDVELHVTVASVDDVEHDADATRRVDHLRAERAFLTSVARENISRSRDPGTRECCLFLFLWKKTPDSDLQTPVMDGNLI